MELSGLTWVFDQLREGIGIWRAQRREHSDQKTTAITALIRALNETEIYYGTRRLIGRDRTKEEEISRLWSNASILLQPIDFDLANRCETKGSYWADPFDYDEDTLRNSRIMLSDMRNSLYAILYEHP